MADSDNLLIAIGETVPPGYGYVATYAAVEKDGPMRLLFLVEAIAFDGHYSAIGAGHAAINEYAFWKIYGGYDVIVGRSLADFPQILEPAFRSQIAEAK